MSAKRPGRLTRATTIVPLALLSAAWTASLANAGPSAVSATGDTDPTIPGGVPEEAISAPATVSEADQAAPAFRGTHAEVDQIVATSSTNSIPASALSAYQRAETVINTADRSCKLPWQLIAAIGRVESNHGRYAGSSLNDQGVAVPAIYGPVLDGKGNVSAIADTDNGTLDHNTSWDRAVGPLQFIPSTWSAVAVDADGDDVRNPQDIDDAALAAAVYLCSGDANLSTTEGQRSAIYRYNHSSSYVALVLQLMNAYLQGDYTAAPNSTLAAGYLTQALPQGNNRHNQVASTSQTQLETGGVDPTTDPTPSTDPTTNGGDDTGNGGNDHGGNNGPLSGLPTPSLPQVTLPALPHTQVKPVDDVLTLAQALLQCTLDGLVDNPGSGSDKYDQCVQDYTTK